METFKIASVGLGAVLWLVVLSGQVCGDEARKIALAKDISIYVENGTLMRAFVCMPTVAKMEQVTAHGRPKKLSLLCDRQIQITPQIAELIASWGSVKDLRIGVPSGDEQFHWLKLLEPLVQLDTLELSISGDSAPLLDELAQLNLKVSLLKLTFITSTVTQESLEKLMDNPRIGKATVQAFNLLPQDLPIGEPLSKRLTIEVMK
jgi:hypothetical protein